MAKQKTAASPPLVGRLESVAAVVILGALGLAIGIAGLLMPTSKAVTRATGYQQVGTFSYSGEAPAGSFYGGQVTSGQPISTSLVKRLTVTFNYRLQSVRPVVVTSGTGAMGATVDLGDGLVRHFAISPSKKVTGSTTRLSGQVPLRAIMHYVTSSQSALPGIQNVPVTVSIAPNITLAGVLAGRPLTATFTHPLAFTLNSGTLEIANQASSASSSGTASGAAASLRSVKAGSVPYRGSVTNHLSLVVVHPPVDVARDAGLGLAALCLLVGLWIGRPLMRSGGVQHDRDRFRAMYGSLLVPVNGLSTPDSAITEVASMGALVELAKRYEAMILHQRRDDGDDYMVWDNGMLYRYSIGAVERTAAQVDEVMTLSGRGDAAVMGSRGAKPLRTGGRRGKRRFETPEAVVGAGLPSPASDWLASLYVTTDMAHPQV